MFDISAFLSLKPAAPGIDPAPVLGMETADIKAFGTILAGQVEGQAGTSGTALPVSPATLPTAAPALPVAGERQASGKILPDGLPVTPDALPPASAQDALPAVPILPAIVIAKAAVSLPKAMADSPVASAEPQTQAPSVAASPTTVPARSAIAAGKRQAPATGAEEDTPDTLTEDTAAQDTTDQVPAADPAPVIVTASRLLPEIVIPAALLVPRPAEAPAPPAMEPDARPMASASPALQAAIQPVATSIVALAAPQAMRPQTAPATSGGPQDAAARSGQPAAPAPLPVLTVTDAPAEAPPITVTVMPPQAAPIASPVANRLRVATAPIPSAGTANSEPSVDAAPLGPASPAGISTAKAETSAVAAFQPAPPAVDVQPQTQQPGLAQAPVHTGPAPSQPGHDFAGLVDRLIEARDASAPQSVHAAVRHAEFGQVSLHFQQDAGGLTVAMSSPDPDFAPAVQAAQSAASANMANDSSSSSQNSAAYQSGGNAALAQGGAREQGTDGQARAAQERQTRPAANPSQSASEGDEPRKRGGGIFA